MGFEMFIVYSGKVEVLWLGPSYLGSPACPFEAHSKPIRHLSHVQACPSYPRKGSMRVAELGGGVVLGDWE